jgi:Putative zinc-finger
MNCDECTNRFGDAVDGTLPAEQIAAIEAHCRNCQNCRETLHDLFEIRAAAASLDRLTPSPDVWNAIAAKIGRPAVNPRFGRPGAAWLPGGLLAAAALVMMLGAAVWFDLGPALRRSQPSDAESAAGIARAAVSELQLAERHYENAIRSLEQLTVNKDNTLDPAVAADIGQSLQSIDRAITDSRAALQSNPESFVAQTSLLEALRMKVTLLQETVSLMNARS